MHMPFDTRIAPCSSVEDFLHTAQKQISRALQAYTNSLIGDELKQSMIDTDSLQFSVYIKNGKTCEFTLEDASDFTEDQHNIFNKKKEGQV